LTKPETYGIVRKNTIIKKYKEVPTMPIEKSKKPAKTTGKVVTKTTAEKAAGTGTKVDWQAFVGKMEQSLLGIKSGIIENLIANNNDFKEIVEGMDPKDLADIASDDIDRKMIEVLGSQELKRLKLIDSALTRIKQGKYGYCMKCEKRIPPDRLEAIPYALMCVECKSEEERRNR
jgi:RNA polymerase-binding protein DksA